MDNTRYGYFVTEYLSAGLLLVLSITFVVADQSGLLVTSTSDHLPSIVREAMSLTSTVGISSVLALVLTSYPVGYVLFGLSLRVLALGGRPEIYKAETSSLKTSPYSTHITDLELASGRGFAAVADFEREFSLIRMFIFVDHRELFHDLNAYWTRLSRMFAVFTLAFLLSLLIFLVSGVSIRLLDLPSALGRDGHFAMAFAAALIAWVCLVAYRRALRNEIRNFVSVAKKLWDNQSRKRTSLRVFAYGSNMLTARLTKRVPSAKAISKGEIREFKLSFHKRGADGSGKATIVSTGNRGDKVYGVVYEIGREEVKNLDLAEPNYRRIRVSEPVQTENGPLEEVETYQARPEALDERLLPFDWYVDLVVAGAKEHDLPDDYCKQLRAALSTTDPDDERRREHQELLQE